MQIMLGTWCSGMAFGLSNKGPGVRAGVSPKRLQRIGIFCYGSNRKKIRLSLMTKTHLPKENSKTK